MSSDDDVMFDTDSDYQATYSRVRIRHGVHQDQGRRRVMEDFHIIEQQFTDLVAREIQSASEPPVYFPLTRSSLYFGLFDGHAGAAAAEFCQQNLHRNIARSIPVSADIGEAMIKGFELTDKEFLEIARRNNEESGSVCVSAILIGDTLHIAHTGDSRAVLCRNGKAIHLTADHKPTCDKEMERVVQNGGTVEWNLLNGYLEVSRAIGDFDCELGLKTRGLSASPEITKVNIHADDEFVIVACDGLWDVMDSAEAIRFARAHLARYNCVDTASEFLVREALRKQSDDNITVLIIGFQKRDPATATGRFVPSDAVVDELPACVLEYFDQEEFQLPEPTPTSSRRRPRFCAKALAQ